MPSRRVDGRAQRERDPRPRSSAHRTARGLERAMPRPPVTAAPSITRRYHDAPRPKGTRDPDGAPARTRGVVEKCRERLGGQALAKATARLEQLIHSPSHRVSLDAAVHVLSIGGITPATAPTATGASLVINISLSRASIEGMRQYRASQRLPTADLDAVLDRPGDRLDLPRPALPSPE
jgi:hypothetical protein